AQSGWHAHRSQGRARRRQGGEMGRDRLGALGRDRGCHDRASRRRLACGAAQSRLLRPLRAHGEMERGLAHRGDAGTHGPLRGPRGLAGEAMTTAAATAPALSFAERLKEAVVTPVRAMRWRYVPLLMVYFAYGVYATLIATAVTFWIRQSLTLTPEELAAIAVWLSVPWTIKMVFGQFVDSIPILGSRRKAYVYIGALLLAGGLLMLAGTAGEWLTFASPEALYVMGSFAMTLGVVLQDVVAHAMTTEVVERRDAAGHPRPQ